MVYYRGYLSVVVGLILSVIEGDLALSCWKCSSQADATCRDYFNTTRIQLNQRHMDAYNYGSLQPARSDPYKAECDEMHTSTYGQFKNVCLKRVFTVQHGPNEVRRECRMVHKDLKVGACPEDLDTNRPRNMEFCGTCEYDGCNSASTNSVIFAALIPTVLILLGK